MSLLINGMDMPKNCYHCRFNYDGLCHALRSSFTYIHENDISCPLFEIPTPHGRLIDADRLIAVLKSTTAISQCDYDLFNHIVGLIEHQPTVIEKEKE